MKAVDVATRLTTEIPKYTDMMSDVINISTIVNTANVSTVTTSSAHNLKVGSSLAITDVLVPLAQSTLTRVATVGTFVASAIHDLTLTIAETITIVNAADANFNGTFTVIEITNRTTVKFTMVNSGATSTTGGELQNAIRYDQGYNGLFQVASITSSTVFTVATTGALAATGSGGKVKTNVRISATASLGRAIEVYTSQDLDKAWLFAVLGNTSVSKDRHTDTDLTSNITRSNHYRQQLMETVTIYIIANTKDEIAGRKVRDEMVDLLVSVTKAIAFYNFPTNLYIQISDPLVLTGHGQVQYDGALYIHEFAFECATEFNFEDTSGFDDDVAFRDIDATYDNTLGTGQTSAIPANANDLMNLDEEP